MLNKNILGYENTYSAEKLSRRIQQQDRQINKQDSKQEVMEQIPTK